MNRIKLSLCFVFLMCLINAQTNQEWPAAGSYRLDTILTKTNVSKLVIAAGAYGQGAKLDPFLLDYGVYGFARFRIAKIAALSAYFNQGFAEMPNGGGTSFQQEATATIYYYNFIGRNQGVKVLDVERDYDQKTTSSAAYNYPAAFFSGVNVSLINKKYFAALDAGNGSIKNKFTDSTISFNSAVTQVNTQMLAFGVSTSNCAKFKGRLFYTTSDGRHGKKMIRRNTSIDITLQCLMALHTNISTNLFAINNKQTASDLSSSIFASQATKRFGWRALMVSRLNSVVSMNMQVGSLPGPKSSTIKGAATLAQNLFLQIGFGFGIGAL